MKHWSPHLQNDIAEAEGVQGRVMRMIKGLEKLPQEEIEKIGIVTLERRQMRGDRIQTHITTGVEKVEGSFCSPVS